MAANAGIQIHAVDDTDGTISAADVDVGHRGGLAPLPRARDRCAGATPTCPRAACPGASTRSRPSSPRRGASPSTWTAPASSTPRSPPVSHAARFAAPVTTVMSCLSKGLCAPVGSVLAGPADVMEQAPRRAAAPGGSHAPGRGHRRGRARGPAHHGGAPGRGPRPGPPPGPGRGRPLARGGLRPRRVPTNMVIFTHPAPDTVVDHLTARASWRGPSPPGVLRLVTHHDVDDAGLDRAIKALAGAP